MMATETSQPARAPRWVIRIGKPAYYMYLVRAEPTGASSWSYDAARAAQFATAADAQAVAERTQRWRDSEHQHVVPVVQVSA